MYEKAIEWLNTKHLEALYNGDKEEQDLIEYIQETLWQDQDMRNS